MQIDRYEKGPSLEIHEAMGEMYNTDPEFSEKFFGLLNEDTIVLYLMDGPSFLDTVRTSFGEDLNARKAHVGRGRE